MALISVPGSMGSMSQNENGDVKLQVGEETPLLGTRLLEQETVDGIPRYESFGYMLLLLSAFGFCLMGLLLRIATAYHAFPVPCIMFIRGVLQTSLALVWIVGFTNAKETFNLSRRLIGLLVLPGVLGGTSMGLIYFGLSRVPLGIHASIFFLTPIFTMVFSSILLGEPFGLIEVGAAITSFIGVVLVSNPRLQLDFSAGQSPGFAIGCCAVLVSSITVALTYCFLRAVNTHVHYMVSVLALGVGGGILGALLGGASPSAMLADTHSLRLVLVGSVGGLFGSCCLSKAFSYCRAGTGTIMRNIDVPIAYILGVVVLGEIPRVGSLIGAALVIAGTVVVGSRSVFRKSAANVETTETLRSG